MTGQLILIGGSAGTGKTTLARTLERELDAGWLQLDTVWLAMRAAVDRTSSAFGALDVPAAIADPARADDDVIAAFVAASEIICRVLPDILTFELEARPVLVADGAWLLPAFVAALTLPDTNIHSVFLYQADVASVAATLESRLEGNPSTARHRLANRRIWQCGEWICEQAEAHRLPMVETLPFGDLIHRVRQVLH